MPAATVAAAMPTTTVAGAMSASTVAATAVPAARVAGTGVARAVRVEMASRVMSVARMASSVVSTQQVSAAGVVPTPVRRRVPGGVSEVMSADEVMAPRPVVRVRPVPEDRGPEVWNHSVPVVEGIVSGRIRTS